MRIHNTSTKIEKKNTKKPVAVLLSIINLFFIICFYHYHYLRYSFNFRNQLNFLPAGHLLCVDTGPGDCPHYSPTGALASFLH
jgi:hypothetical protein